MSQTRKTNDTDADSSAGHNAEPIDFDQAKVRFDEASALAAAGQHEASVAAYLDVLQVVPDLGPAYFNLGNGYLALKRFDEAVAAFERVVELDADAASFNNLGNALASANQTERAVGAFRDALKLDPTFTPAVNNLGPALEQLGQSDEAISWLLKSVELSPKNPRSHANLGDFFYRQGEIENAIGCYEQSVKLNSKQTDVWVSLGACQSGIGRLTEAAGSYVMAQQLNPDDARIYNNLGELNRRRGQVTEAQFCYIRSLQLAPDLHETHSNWLLTMVYDAEVSAARLLEEANNWARQHATSVPRLSAPTNDRAATRRLRIGYLSADFRKHPVGYLFEPVLRSHDRQNVEVVCYANQSAGDALTETLRGYADQWHFVDAMTDEELADLIRRDRIDILVELSGHTAENRLRVLARKPAPVQASWLGYWGTTGVKEIDYVIADETVIPESEQKYYTETAFRLPECYACFGPPDDAPGVNTLPALSSDGITFGCLNNIAKMTPAVIRRWSSVLLAVPGSRLFLKTPALDDAEVCERIRGSFGENFIGSERLHFEGGGTRNEMLAAYGEIDIALDPFPFNGGLTTLESLWMGVPVVALRGKRFASHASESFLRTIGMEDWVADSKEEYTELSVARAGDREGLAEVRGTLRDRMRQSPLCDHRGFTEQLEAAYRQMWQRWCES